MSGELNKDELKISENTITSYNVGNGLARSAFEEYD